MKPNKKTIMILAIFLLVLIVVVAPAIKSIVNYGSIVNLNGKGWADTPEEAIELKIQQLHDRHEESKEGCYKIKTFIDEIHFENEMYYLYISEADSFSVLNMVFNDTKEQWRVIELYVYQYDENIEISADYDFKVNLWGGLHFYLSNDKSTAFGFMETGIAETYYINNTKAEVKVYTFEVNGKTYSIDYVYVTDLPEGITYGDIESSYV